jgi:hypothetical protein
MTLSFGKTKGLNNKFLNLNITEVDTSAAMKRKYFNFTCHVRGSSALLAELI